VITSFAVVGISAVLLWATHRSVSLSATKQCRMQRRLANVAGELSILRDKIEGRDK
jgi:hypothetical protein